MSARSSRIPEDRRGSPLVTTILAATALCLLAPYAAMPETANGPAARASDGTSIENPKASGSSPSGGAQLPEGLNPEAALLARLSGVFAIEDPTSIYSFDIDDNDVEFVLDGSWETRLDSFFTLTFDKGTMTTAYTPPIFTQAVDLSTWILINQTWYFESSFQEEFTKNTVAAGYLGKEGDLVRHARIGNSRIVFPDSYPFITIGGGTAIAPGVMGTFGGKNWNADTIVRYDAAAQRELTLSGMNEVMDEYVSVASFARGKWFVLPDAPVRGAVVVYVTDSSGAYRDGSSRVAGRRWRKLEQAEYTVRGTDGILELNKETVESVAIFYYGSYAASAAAPGPSLVSFVGGTRDYFDGISASMPAGYLPDPSSAGYSAALADRFLVDINGTPALLVRERGHFSPFEILSRYRGDTSSPELLYQNSGISPNTLGVDSLDGTYVEVFRTDYDAPESVRDPESRFPLARELPFLYLPSGGGQRTDTDLALLNRTWKPVSNIALGANAIAGTIQVTRNGIADAAFRFDDETGILTLEKQPSSTETIHVTWYDTDDSARNATLTIAGGTRWRPTDPFELFTASAFRWNVTKAGYTDQDERSPGSFIMMAGSRYSRDKLKAMTAFALDVSVPDTTGLYRALGMDTGTNEMYPDDDWYETIPGESLITLGLPARASPLTLGTADFVLPTGSDDAPPTVTDPSMTGAVLALSCDLASPNAWSGASILTEKNASVDWSGASTVSVWLKNPGSSADFDVYLQLGPHSAKDSGAGEDSGAVRTWKLQTPEATGSWVKRTVTLTDEDRAALSGGGNARIVVRPSSTIFPTPATPLAVTLRMGALSYTLSKFTAKATPPFSGSSGTLSVEQASDPAPSSLTGSFDDARTFNAGNVNTALIARFTPEADTERITLSGHVSPIPLESYHGISFFVYASAIPPDGAGSVIRVSMTRPGSSGVGEKTALELELSPSALPPGSWHRVSCDLESRTVSVDGDDLSADRGRVVSIDREVSPTRVEFAMEHWPRPATDPSAGDTAYTIAFDEVYLSETDPIYTYRNRSEFSWKKQGAVVSAGRHAIVSDPRIELTADSSVRHDGTKPFSAGTAAGGVSILRARADGTITASSETARVADSTSHSVSVPFGPLVLREGFTADFIGNDYSRTDSISLSGPLGVGATVGVDLDGRNLARKDSFSVTPAFPATRIGLFAAKGSADLSQSGLAPESNIEKEKWGELWFDTFRYSLSTGESDATKRDAKATLETGWTAETGSGIRVTADAASAYASSSAVSVKSTYGLGLATPIKIGSSTLTPSWDRTASETRAMDAGGSYSTDADFLASSFPRLDFLYETAPFADLFLSDVDERIADSGHVYSRAFKNRYGVSWTRPSIGRLSDLWVPVSVDTAIARLTETDATVSNVSDEWDATVTAGLSALNVAGAFGVRRIFKWYDQDEISQLYSWKGSWGDSWFTWNVDTLHSLMLLFPEKGSFTTDNAFHYDSPDIAGKGKLVRDTVRIIWKRPGKDSLVADVAARFTKQRLSTMREETLAVTVTRSDENSEAFSFDHVLKTGIGANGEVSLNSGVSWTRNDAQVTTVELRLGIGGKLTY